MNERILIQELKQHISEKVTIKGWVFIRRDQGKLIFLDIRDRSGLVQAVILPNQTQALEIAKDIRSQFVVEVVAQVNQRPEKNKQENVENGDIELEIFEISILAAAQTPAFDITSDGKEISDEHRLTQRYLDLRRPRMQKNLRMRHKLAKMIRDELDNQGFIEVETPLLTKSTPEGSRDFIVPFRKQKGKCYALPQSPQQYKQLLMTAGVERYFQVAKCMRDEDSRGDRQPEFTQIDMELSFASKEEIMQINESLLIRLVTTLYPEKKIQEIPFPRITYKEAMETYGNDRPDIRNDKNDEHLLAFCWVVDFPFFEETNLSDNPNTFGNWTFTHNPFSKPIDEHMDLLKKKENIGEILTTQYDIVLNGYEIGGGSIRNHKAEDLLSVFEILGYEQETIKRDFGHMLDAFSSGTPPHGGIAWGFDRLVMLFENEPNIQEVIAFPKTREGNDLMMKAPTQIASKQTKELGITFIS
jgi:aspartyl-tRNA synthetase